MAFDRTYFNTLSSGAAGGQRVFSYTDDTDTLMEIADDDYFLSAYTSLSAGDLVDIYAADGRGRFEVGTSSSSTVTMARSAGLCQVRVTIPTASVLTLRATPYTLVAAPGAGKILVFDSALLQLDYNSVGYTETADNMDIKYTNASGVVVSTTIESTGFIDQTADTFTRALAVLNGITANSAGEDAPLVLDNTGDGEFASGNSPLVVDSFFYVVPGV